MRPALASALACALLVAAAGGCTMGRQYMGAEFAVDPREFIVPGETTMSDVLQVLGAPDRIQRRREGEVFVYSFRRRNTSGVRLMEPVVTRITFFRYDKRQEKSERLVVLFDEQRRVIDFGHTNSMAELDPY